MASSKKKVGTGIAVVLALAMLGSCVDDDERREDSAEGSPTTVTTTVPVRDRTEWVGTVIEHDTYGAALTIDLDGRQQTVGLAHVNAVTCGPNYSAGKDALRHRLTQLVPIGSTVRVARTVSSGGYLDDDGFVYVEHSSSATAPIATTTSPTNSTAAPATTTAAVSPTSELAGTGTTVNLAVMSEGLANLGTRVNLSTLAPTPADTAIATLLTANSSGSAATHLPKVVDAYRAAWDNRVGMQAICRADDDAALVRDEQRRELDRLKAGPDGQLYTVDDDNTDYRYDENGTLYVQEPTYSSGYSGGGGGGGESRFCSRRWWC